MKAISPKEVTLKNFDAFLETIQSFLGGVVANTALAIVAIIVGLMVIGWVMRLLEHALMPAKIDPTLKPFILSFTSIVLRVILVISIYQNVGGQVTSVVAMLGAASLAVGLAFQGALSNFAGGVLLLSLRPFHVGDFIEVTGFQGKVEAIHVFNTVIVTLDNKVISVPNGAVAGASIVNFTQKDKRRVDLTFGVSYDSDLKAVVRAIEEVANNHPKVLQEPAPFIRLGSQGSSSLDFTVRLWCNTPDYWAVHFDIIEQVTDSFNRNNISIPFPQMDIHLDK